MNKHFVAFAPKMQTGWCVNAFMFHLKGLKGRSADPPKTNVLEGLMFADVFFYRLKRKYHSLGYNKNDTHQVDLKISKGWASFLLQWSHLYVVLSSELWFSRTSILCSQDFVIWTQLCCIFYSTLMCPRSWRFTWQNFCFSLYLRKSPQEHMAQTKTQLSLSLSLFFAC